VVSFLCELGGLCGEKFGLGPQRNTKHEIRNPKQIRITKTQNSKRTRRLISKAVMTAGFQCQKEKQEVE
jgi:hypothetical protein